MSTRGGAAFKRTLSVLLILLLLGAGAFAWANRQEIRDYTTARAFSPSARVAALTDSMQLTQDGERLFRASRPTIDGSQHFNEQCADVMGTHQGHVLGCFSKQQIHLYEVTDTRLSGIVEVTAAHELLHAAWSRIPEGERERIGKELVKVYREAVRAEPQLASRMDVYDHLSEAAYANELHSVLGTEITDLPDELERHYAIWFADRSTLTSRFQNYHAVFDELQGNVSTLEANMSTLRESVEHRSRKYERAVQSFNDDVEALEKRKARNEFKKSRSEYRRQSDQLATRRDELQVTLDDIQEDIDRYNSMRDELTSLSELSSELDQHLNSSLAPISTRPSTDD